MSTLVIRQAATSPPKFSCQARFAMPNLARPLPQLLGARYERAGLRPQATNAYQEAQLLMDAGRPSEPPPR